MTDSRSVCSTYRSNDPVAVSSDATDTEEWGHSITILYFAGKLALDALHNNPNRI